MNIKQYSKDVCDYIDNLTDEEFDELLLRSGIENCPYKDIDGEAKREQWVTKILSPTLCVGEPNRKLREA